jgi:hypothetical protein
MPDRSGDFDDPRQSPACHRAAHADCPHAFGSGVGFNPRRLRFEAGEVLCRCPCHDACPVTSPKRLSVSKKHWYAFCTCSGAAALRQRLDDAGIEPRDLSDMWEERRSRSRAGREAFKTTQARAAGLSREEIRETYIAERLARQLNVPAEPVLDAVVERIAGNPLPVARLLGEHVVQLGQGIHDLYRVLDPDNGRGGRHAKGGSADSR